MKSTQHPPRGAAHSLVALQVAEQAAIATLELVSKLPPPLKVYKDQAIRAVDDIHRAKRSIASSSTS